MSCCVVSDTQECIKDTSLCGHFRHKCGREHEDFCLSPNKKWPQQDWPFNTVSSHGGFTQLPHNQTWLGHDRFGSFMSWSCRISSVIIGSHAELLGKKEMKCLGALLVISSLHFFFTWAWKDSVVCIVDMRVLHLQGQEGQDRGGGHLNMNYVLK